MGGQWKQRRFMRPVLEKTAIASASPGSTIEQGRIVWPEPRVGWQIVCTREDVDTVDLMQAQLLDRPAQMPLMDHNGLAGTKALRRERDTPSLSDADCFS